MTFAVLAVISIAACFLPYTKQQIPQLAMFIGSDKFITYPVIQYMVYFAFGVLLCKKEWVFRKVILAGSALASIPAIWYYFRNDILPMRFPPSWIFVLGAFWFVYLYYLLCSYLDRIKGTNDMVEKVVRFFRTIGCNSLFYLLLSNMLIFAFAGSAFSFRDFKYVIGFFLFLMLFIPYLQRMIKNIKVT